jgi:hypothetical protein
VAQFFRAAFARVRANEWTLIREHLTPAQAELFERMHRGDQRHCLDVYHTLVRAGYQQKDLLVAALLHDAGKAVSASPDGRRRMTIFHRVAVVLLQGIPPLGPRWLARLAADGRGWKAPFAVHARHAQVGAEWAGGAGCSPTVVDLIRVHHSTRNAQTNESETLAARLQWADEQN